MTFLCVIYLAFCDTFRYEWTLGWKSTDVPKNQTYPGIGAYTGFVAKGRRSCGAMPMPESEISTISCLENSTWGKLTGNTCIGKCKRYYRSVTFTPNI